MRILYITPSFQHPEVRGPHRHYHFIRELSKRHKITLLTLKRSKIAPGAIAEMQSLTERILTFDANGTSNSDVGSLVGKLPVLGAHLMQNRKLRDSINQMKKAFLELVNQESFDLVLFHGKSVFPVIKEFNELPIVVDFCDATSMRIRNKMHYTGIAKLPLLLIRLLQIRQIERQLVNKTPHIAFISNRDRTTILGFKNKSEIIPIGVDQNYWKRKTKQSNRNCIIFTGVMDYAPNHDAAVYLIDKILPLLKNRISNLEVLIAGRDPKPELVEKARRHSEITITGFVEDMRVYLERAAVFAAPLRYGSGIQNKVLEAMAMEVPVVSTKIVADGLYLDSYGEPPLHKADTENELAESIIKLLKDEKERSRLANEGRMFVEKYFNWECSSKKLEKLCLHAMKSN